jgi:hypothetical protein
VRHSPLAAGLAVEVAATVAARDPQRLHYRLHLGRVAIRWVCTQTAVCRLVDGRPAAIDLLCSGFRKIENDDTQKIDAVSAPSGARLVGAVAASTSAA